MKKHAICQSSSCRKSCSSQVFTCNLSSLCQLIMIIIRRKGNLTHGILPVVILIAKKQMEYTLNINQQNLFLKKYDAYN